MKDTLQQQKDLIYMKFKFRNIALIIGCIVSINTAFATNGDNLIGYGAISSSMGGAGVALPMGPEGILKNPALTHSEKEFEFVFAGTYFTPTVSANVAGTPELSSAANAFMIPSIGLSSRINDQLSFGLGAYGVSGLGVDYRSTAVTSGLSKMSTSLSLLKIAPALSYQNENLRVGGSLAMMYGTLAISYDRTPNTTNIGNESPGKSEDLGYGYDLGIAYLWNDFTFGANYQSKIAMTYDYQLKEAAADFGISNELNSDELTQPEEIALGVSYKYSALTMTLDYRMINWSKASGYKEFGWDDQTVYALGGAYQLTDETILRAGYNFSPAHVLGERAIKNSTTGTRNPVNFFNLIGFPATTKSHYTLGVTQSLSKTFNLDAAYVYSPQEKDTTTFNGGAGDMNYESRHSESSVTVAGRWNF